MTGITFLEKRQAAFEAIVKQFEEDSQRPEGFDDFVEKARAELAARGERPNEGPSKDGGEDEGTARSGEIIEYWHVTGRIHLEKFLLEKDEVKEILAEECLHYARVCRIAIVHYCVMDNHFHLVVGLRRDSHNLSKMIGCIKQQFTNKFKIWFNKQYRPQNRYRRPALGKGTLWDGPPKPELIESEVQLGACTVYVENNRLVVVCKDEIGALEESPAFILTEEGEEAEEPEFMLQPCYQELLAKLKGYRFQSAAHYLGAAPAQDTILTDGQDAIWASEADVACWYTVAKKNLPEGFRKVWFKECPGILIETPPDERSYAKNPFYERLGKTDALRSVHFGRLLLGSCFRKRHQIAKIETSVHDTEPGLSLD
ncbi:MAG: transposase [Bradymonadaceae bacterium]